MSGEAGETSNNMTADSINKHIPIHPIFRHHLQHTIIWTHENACCHAILAPSIYRFRDMKLLNNLSQQKILWASNERKFGRSRCLMASDTALFVESYFFFITDLTQRQFSSCNRGVVNFLLPGKASKKIKE